VFALFGCVDPRNIFRLAGDMSGAQELVDLVFGLRLSRSLTWNLKMAPWRRRFLLETIIFRFHVKLG